MVTCANITLEKIRCRVTFGTLEFETPEVLSFSVNQSRGTLPASFNCSLEVPANTVFPTNQDIVIEAGTLGNLQRLITAHVLSITVNPSFEDAANYVVNLSGQDSFHELEGKNISRRQRTRGGVTFAAITSIISKAPQKGTSLELHKQSGGSSRVPSPDTNLREHSKLVKTDRVGWDPFGTAKDPERKDTSGEEADIGNILDIKPKAVALSPGVRALYQVQGTSYSSGDTWTVSDEDIGTIVDNGDGTATYTQIGIGENTITYTDSSGSTFTGTATAVGIPIHDHSSLGAGGPAFAVYGTD
jgi:hypothetical protein